MFGGELSLRSNEKLIKTWSAIIDQVEASQNIITGISPSFQQPLISESLQGLVTLSANVTAYLRKKSSDSRVWETRNAGRIELEVVREDGVATGNPWRIAKTKAIPVWDEGGKEFWQAQ